MFLLVCISPVFPWQLSYCTMNPLFAVFAFIIGQSETWEIFDNNFHYMLLTVINKTELCFEFLRCFAWQQGTLKTIQERRFQKNKLKQFLDEAWMRLLSNIIVVYTSLSCLND